MLSRSIDGTPMNPWDLAPDLITIEHIARSLARINRYAGHWVNPISVARHCVNMAEDVKLAGPMVQLQALFHDASEAYTSDIPAPLKDTLWIETPRPEGIARHDTIPYREVEDRLLRQIFVHLGIDWPMNPQVLHADKVAYDQELPIVRGEHAAHDTPEWAERDFIEAAHSLLRSARRQVAVTGH
jgi:hypothetical protein